MNDPRRNNSQGGGNSGGPGNQPPRPRITIGSWLTLLIIAILFNLFVYGPLLTGGTPNQTGPTDNISYSVFLAQVRANNVKTAKISPDTITGEFVKPYHDPSKKADYTSYSTPTLPVPDQNLVPLLQQHHVSFIGAQTSTPLWANIFGVLLNALPLLLLVGLFVFGAQAARRQQQGIFGFGQSRAKLYTEERPSTTFDDVAGVEAAKAELQEEVDFLRDPSKYQRLGAKIPKGVLLVGPPGTGKTLLARAVAGEARVPFFSISATEFVEVFVGVGASRVRDLFEKAKAAQPAIIFIDEIDAIGRQRGTGGPLGGGTNDEREQTLNQLLVCLDGFEPSQAVIVLAATNRPDVLDQALLRPGRFDRQVSLELPDRRGREAILRVHTRPLPLAPGVDLEALAQATPGMSGADLANLANEAALMAARQGAERVAPADFDAALDRITLGAPGNLLMSAEERRTVAYHEGGHALVALLVPNADPVHRVTITPRGRSLGVTQFRPSDDRCNYRRDYLLDRLAVGLGGRAAEEIACGEISSGAQNDLQDVTRLARAMVTQLGMAEELGPEYFGGASDSVLGGRGYNPWEPKEYSERTAERIDAAVHRLIEEAHERAGTLLRRHRSTLEAIAEALLREETLEGEELLALAYAEQAGPPDLEPTSAPDRLASR